MEPTAKDPGVYDELSAFLQRIRERLDHEIAMADQAEAHAKMARYRAEETRRIYETMAKLHDSMANKPATEPNTVTASFPPPPGGWRVQYEP